MKKVFLIAILGILSLNIFSQDSFSLLAYQATKLTTLDINTGEREVSLSETVFQFDPKKATVGTYGNLRHFIIEGNAFSDTLSTGHVVWRVQAIDNYGRRCGISLNSSDPFISIEYNNKIFFYNITVLSERPWSYPEDITPYEVRTEPYTQEEIDNFFKAYESLKGQVINSIVKPILKDIL